MKKSKVLGFVSKAIDKTFDFAHRHPVITGTVIGAVSVLAGERVVHHVMNPKTEEVVSKHMLLKNYDLLTKEHLLETFPDLVEHFKETPDVMEAIENSKYYGILLNV